MRNIDRDESEVKSSGAGIGHNSQDLSKLFQLQYEIGEALAQKELAKLVGMSRHKACALHGVDAGASTAGTTSAVMWCRPWAPSSLSFASGAATRRGRIGDASSSD